MIIILKGLISNSKIYRALKYIILNTLGIDSPPPHSHKNQGISNYVDKKCKISTHFYHPKGSSIHVIRPIKKSKAYCVYKSYYYIFIKKWLYYNNYIHVKGFSSMGQYLVLTKKLIIFICMKIFQHFCDVLIPYYKIATLNFYYHMLNIALYGILFQKLLGDSIFCPFKQIVT